MTDLTSQDLGRVVRVATDKTKRELALPTKQPATVIEYQDSSDSNVPRAMVHFDDAPADHTAMVKVHGGPVASGDRVHVGFDPPHGMTIDRSASSSGGAGPMFCDDVPNGEGAAEVTFTLTEQRQVAIVFDTDCGLASWSIDGNTVSSPVGQNVATMVVLGAGEHTISVTEASCGG